MPNPGTRERHFPSSFPLGPSRSVEVLIGIGDPEPQPLVRW
jgi:hypothetical protein